MKKKLTLVYPHCEDAKRTERLNSVLQDILSGYDCTAMRYAEDFTPIRDGKVLFAVPLGISGINLEYCRFLKILRTHPDMLAGSTGGIIVDGESELYTKAVARELMFTANQAGCAFPGRAMVEGTASLQNFNIQAMKLETDNLSAYHIAAAEMLERVSNFRLQPKERPNILVLHASSHKTSNTVALWNMVKEGLAGCKITEISLRNGEIQDCGGCPYHMCMHFSEKSSCYYGGVIVEQVYPAIQECDALVLLCPNYNDAPSANIIAFVNRLTALFRKTAFYEKSVFAVVVSGYSGGDIVAEQVISSLSMNKTFRLPPKFAMVETANDPLSILKVEGIRERAAAFAERIRENI